MLGLLLSFVPAQTKRGVGLSIERGSDHCAGLSAEECCAQTLKLASFRAVGEHLPKKAQTSVRLSCNANKRVVPKGACRTIAVSRGFSARDLGTICGPTAKLERKCRADGECRRCSSELRRLSYRKGHNACYPVTFVPEASSKSKVVVIRNGSGGADGDTRFEVRRRR